MKIAIYYPWVYLTSGVERTILETVKRSKHDYTIFTNHFDIKNTFPEFKKIKLVELKKIPVRRNIIDTLKAAIVIIFQKIDLKNFDLLLVHSEGLGDLILVRNHNLPTVCFCHTPLRPVFDIEYKRRVYEKKNNYQKLIYHFFAFLFRFVDRYLWKKYKYIFFNSEETLKRAKVGGLIKGKKRKFEILHPGVDAKAIKPSWVYKPYFFLPGRIMWAKNIELAISSFKELKRRNPSLKSFKLIIAGRVDEKSKGYLAKLRSLSKNKLDIRFVINPSDYKMRKLYENCWAVISASFNEDWGVTVIEGNAFGKPSVCVNRGGLIESQINGKTGFLVELAVGKFADALAKIASDKNLVIKLGENARINSLKYDWNSFSQRFDNVLTKLG